MHFFKACNEDGDDKINELSNFKCNVVSYFNKLRDTGNELSSENFLRTLNNSILNNNEKLNIQLN